MCDAPCDPGSASSTRCAPEFAEPAYTSRPKLNVTEATVDASYGVTAHGNPSSAVDAIINLPLVQDRLAVRAVIYNDSRGGYINNRPSTFSRASTDRVVVNYFGGVVPPNSGPINNSGSVANAINPVTYQAGGQSCVIRSTTTGRR